MSNWPRGPECLTCKGCGEEMRGIRNYGLREICYSCGGKSKVKRTTAVVPAYVPPKE